MVRFALVAVATAALALAASALPAIGVTTRTAWSRPAPPGPLLPGPGGGVVVVGEADAFDYVISAYRRDGRRIWSLARRAGCGNCDDGEQPERRQPDGTFGPIGPEGDDIWAVDARGREVRGCSGALLADGTCVAAGTLRSPGDDSGPPAVFASRGGSRLWSVADARYRWQDDFDVPPVLVSDGTLAYTAFGGVIDAATGADAGSLLVAVDPLTRTIRWTRSGPWRVLTALGRGVLVAEGDGVVAVGADGTVRWTRSGIDARARQTVYDERRSRLYLGSRRGAPAVVALDAATGRERWRTGGAARARLLSVGRGGRVYVALDRAGRPAVRALRLRDGGTAWQRRTRRPVFGALELPDGTVAVSAGDGEGGVLTLLDPRPPRRG